jgi:outer membrane protein TolC
MITTELKRVFIVLIFILAVLVSPAKSQVQSPSDENPQPRILSLDECLSIADTENIGLQRIRLGIDTSLIGRIKAEAAFDPGFDLKFTGSGPASSQSGSASESMIFDLSEAYTLPTDSGSSWIFSLDQSRSNGTQTVDSSPVDYTLFASRLGVGFSMPLLEGHDQRVNRLAINQADLEIIRSEARVRDTTRALRLTIIQSYIGAVLAERQIEVAQLSLDSARNLVEGVQARIDAGVLAPYELLAAQAGLADREEALLKAQAGFEVALDALKNLIGIPLEEAIMVDTSILRPIFLEVSQDGLFYDAQMNRPDLLDIDLRTRESELVLLAAQDRVQASLLWNTQVGLSGQGTNYLDTYDQLGNFAWSTGLEYRVPLGGNRAAVADVSMSELSLQQLELERTDFLRSLQTEIKSALEEFRSAVARVDVTQQGLKVQEVKMESEQARLRLGLITSRDLLQFDLDLANARLAYASAMADALLAVAKLENLSGMILLDDVVTISAGVDNQEPVE